MTAKKRYRTAVYYLVNALLLVLVVPIAVLMLSAEALAKASERSLDSLDIVRSAFDIWRTRCR
jgi:hypothetical protein